MMTRFFVCMTFLWNETIDDLEVDEFDNETWSLADISQDLVTPFHCQPHRRVGYPFRERI